ncbi:extensin family protein [Jannaschia sp. Os4]|uniref:extensin-like domain-containing protein n=1 Tax=Jannaschia sp. Os4 TaxID=2807617 RepID=UPI00193AB0B8|nr:extensin family protein [Jannaschia sp. Os4]MBM2575132.1 extensin family protein [Jannaschia sp. Os4]
MTRLITLLLLCATGAQAAVAPVPRPDTPYAREAAARAEAAALRPGEDDMRPTVRPYRFTTPDGTYRPTSRPAITRAMLAEMRDPLPKVEAAGTVRRSVLPKFKPLEAMRNAFRRREREAPQSVPGGGLCGMPTLVGEAIGAVPGNGACGIPSAVRVRSVAGVALSQPARMDCDTARAFDAWVRGAAIPAFGQRSRLVGMQMASAYSCRRIAGSGKLSEHGKGRAIDISSFTLADGTRVRLIDGWNGPYGQILRNVHRAACGTFKTVLGPNANAAHRDHFHFDMAQRRSGQAYCR